MAVNIKLVKKDEQKVSRWSGGTTTELYIYPEESVYAERNFGFRVSSAVVELEESVFTKLDGIWRKIMILEGSLKLIHEGHHETLLKRFEGDSFSGEWNTKSIGKVTDFNLMTSDGFRGDIEAVTLSAFEDKNVSLEDAGEEFLMVYSLSAKMMKVQVNDYCEELSQKDVLIIHIKDENPVIKVNGTDDKAEIVLTKVYIN